MKRVEWALLTWPQAFALVFGGVPALMFLLGALAVHPAIMFPAYGLAAGVHVWRVQTQRRDGLRAIAARADVQHAALRVSEPDRFPTLQHERRWHA
ncbi:hypothetical protein [Mycobacterium sp. SMC-17]|uniref:hypothetical protein n=1 Tax=Mycobacterium sp. SMC-17 TaxID=3381628 RepID=UPI003876AE4F